MATPGELNITVYYNASHGLVIQFKDSDGNDFDISSYTDFLMRLYPVSSRSQIGSDIDLTRTGSQLDHTFSVEDIQGYPSNMRHEILFKNGADVDPVLRGNLTVTDVLKDDTVSTSAEVTLTGDVNVVTVSDVVLTNVETAFTNATDQAFADADYLFGQDSSGNLIKDTWADVKGAIVSLYSGRNLSSAAELNALIVEVNNDGGGTIYLGENNITCGTQVVLKQDVHFIGGTLTLGFNGDLVDYSVDNWSFQNTTFDGDKANFSGNGFNASNALTSIRYFSFKGCAFQNFTGHGFIHKSTANYIFEYTSFQNCDDYCIYESPDGVDSARYGSYISCESRDSKGTLLTETGSRSNYYYFRSQIHSEHAYKISGAAPQDNTYDGAINDMDGSAFHCTANINCDIRFRASGNCLNPPAQYEGRDPSQFYHNSPGSASFITFSKGRIVNSDATPNVAIDDASTSLLNATILGAFQINGEVNGGFYTVLSDENVGLADFSGAVQYIKFDPRFTAARTPEISSKNGTLRVGVRVSPFITTSGATLDKERDYHRVDARSNPITVDLFGGFGGQEITIQNFYGGNTVTINAPSGISLYSDVTTLSSAGEAITLVALSATQWYKK